MVDDRHEDPTGEARRPDAHASGAGLPGAGRVPVRRRPDMVRFLVAGGFVGFVVGAVVGRYGPDIPTSGALQEIVLLGGLGLLVGLLIASVVYLVADGRSQRSVR